MNRGLLGSFNRLHGSSDQRFSRLGQDLNRHIFGCIFHCVPGKVEIGLGCRRKRHFDLFEPNLKQFVKVFFLFCDGHGIWQCLITVSKIGREPSGGLGDGLVGPCSVRKCYSFESLVLFRRVFQHIGVRLGSRSLL